MKSVIVILFSLLCCQTHASGMGEYIPLFITFSPTLSLFMTSDSLGKKHEKAEVKAAQSDAILYVQNLSEGHEGLITPVLQRGVEIVSQLPEAQSLSQDQLIFALAFSNLD